MPPLVETLPSADGYDTIIFGTPVRGGTVPSPMSRYLEQLPSLQGKKVAFLITDFFRPQWGANQVVAALKTTCEAKGATICGSGDVKWAGFGRQRKIEEAVENLCKFFS